MRRGRKASGLLKIKTKIAGLRNLGISQNENFSKNPLSLLVYSPSTAAVAEQMDLSNTDTTSFTVNGTVEKVCKVDNSSGPSKTIALDGVATAGFGVGFWCNTSAMPTITYSSQNGGVLALNNDPQAGFIPYTMDHGSAVGVSLTSPYSMTGNGNMSVTTPMVTSIAVP